VQIVGHVVPRRHSSSARRIDDELRLDVTDGKVTEH
jgi:hypothetical protein